MAIVPLQKIRVFVPIADTNRLVDVLQDFGCLEIVPDVGVDRNKEKIEHTETLKTQHQYARIEMARTFFNQYYEEGLLRTMFEGARSYTSDTELKTLSTSTDAAAMITKAEDFQGQLAKLESKEREISDELHTLEAWERFDLPLNTVTETALTITYALRGSGRLLHRTLELINNEVGNLHEVRQVSVEAALVTFLKINQSKVEELISAGGVEVIKLPDSNSTAATLLTNLRAQHIKIITDQASLTQNIREVALEYLPLLRKFSDLSRWNLEKTEVAAATFTTDSMAVVTAWAPVRQLDSISQKIDATIKTNAIEHLAPQDDETVPSELENNSWIKSFEPVTKLYGSPFYHDLDPTPYLSIFFVLFFGFCLSDAGYGLFLMLVTGLILWRYHLDSETRSMIKLLFYGGVSTVIMGALFGGYFGVSPADLGKMHPSLEFLVTLQAFDPINDPMPVFFFAIILGFIHLAFGASLNLYRKIKLGCTKEALLEDAPWLYLFFLIVLYTASTTGFLRTNISEFVTQNTATLFGSAVLLLILTQGHAQKNIVMKLLSGVLGLYGVVGYFADMLSYSRLMALGLATGALAFSINSIALFVGGDSLGIGTLLMIFVLIFGHSLNIAISLLGTFINSSRLQFVEFFSKFTTGSGRPFSPFRKETRHTIILSESPPR